MFILNDDMSIYITRGDTAVISVDATDQNGNSYVFQPGDVVRFKVVEKKNYDNVVLQRDFAVESATTIVSVLLEERDTRIGDVISKPVDYWYEVELNPHTNPQTIIGYDDYGAKIFKLLPEGKDLVVDITEDDIPLVDAELSLTSERPIQNQAVARAMMNLENTVEETETRVLNAVETVEAFDEEIAEIKAGIDEVNVKLDAQLSTSDLEKVNSDLNTPLDELVKSGAIPIVKSVQRGTSASSDDHDTVIEISEINPNKAVVILKSFSNYAGLVEPVLKELTSTALTVEGGYVSGGVAYKFSWQIIEFY